MNINPQRYLISVTEWHKMGEYQIFQPETRLELLEGEIIKMSPIGFLHAECVTHLIHLFVPQVIGVAKVSVQSPIQLSDFSEPEPDLVLLRPSSQLYQNGHPTPTDILLLIEVSDTTLKYDRQRKMPLYAREGITESWLVNLEAKQVEVYLNPTAAGYTKIKKATRNDTLIPSQLPQVKIPLAEIFR